MVFPILLKGGGLVGRARGVSRYATIAPMLKSVGLLAALLVLGPAGADAAGEKTADWTWEAIGRAQVINGDTIRLRGVKIRFYGIDAPELDQVCKTGQGIPWGCGVAAKVRLEELIGSRQVRCFGWPGGLDKDGRQAGICHVWGIHNLNASMVREGLAISYKSKKYLNAQDLAKSRRRGMWNGEFTPPWKWRQGHRL